MMVSVLNLMNVYGWCGIKCTALRLPWMKRASAGLSIYPLFTHIEAQKIAKGKPASTG